MELSIPVCLRDVIVSANDEVAKHETRLQLVTRLERLFNRANGLNWLSIMGFIYQTPRGGIPSLLAYSSNCVLVILSLSVEHLSIRRVNRKSSTDPRVIFTSHRKPCCKANQKFPKCYELGTETARNMKYLSQIAC
jgi:hypothetical protein